MNRRGFFNRLGLIVGAASCSPTLFIPKFEPVAWKVATPEITYFSFTQFLIDQTPKFDAMIIEGMTLDYRSFQGKWRFEGLDSTIDVTPNTPLYPFPRQPFFEPRSECRP